MDEEAFLRLLGIVPINERMEMLRGILAQKPSPQAWQEVCDHFDQRWLEFDEDLDLGLVYADEHMAHWPDELRVLPRHWEPDPGYGGYTFYKVQLARVCAPEDPQSCGYLIHVHDYMPFEHGPKPSTEGLLPWKDPKTGQHLVWSRDTRRLMLKDSDGNTLAQTSFELPKPTGEREGHNFGFSACGAYVWLMGYGPDGTSHIYLLNRHDLSIKDQTPLRQPDMSEYELDQGWSQQFMVSPDGRRLAIASEENLSRGISCVFWHEGGQIKVTNTPYLEYEPGEIAGFSPDSTLFLFVGFYGELRRWDLTTGQRLAGAAPHENAPTDRRLWYALNSAGRMYYSDTLLFVPIQAMPSDHHEPCSWGIGIIDPHTGTQLGCVEAPETAGRGSYEAINMLSDRLCECPDEGKLRYLPSLTFLQNHASTRHDAAAQDD